MTTPNAPKATLVDSKIDIKIRLSALWAAIVFFFIYGDYFALYVPGKLGEIRVRARVRSMSANNIGRSERFRVVSSNSKHAGGT